MKNFIFKYRTILLSITIVTVINIGFFVWLEQLGFFNYSLNRFWLYGLGVVVVILYQLHQDELRYSLAVLLMFSLIIMLPSIPKRIAQPEHFEKLCSYSDHNFYIARDIDFSDYKNVEESAYYGETVYFDCSFSGNLNGLNHTISNTEHRIINSINSDTNMDKISVIKNVKFEYNKAPILFSLHMTIANNITISNSDISDYKTVFVDRIWVSRLNDITIDNPSITGDSVGILSYAYAYTVVKNINILNVTANVEKLGLITNRIDTGCTYDRKTISDEPDVSYLNASVSSLTGELALGNEMCNVGFEHLQITGPDSIEIKYYEDSKWVDVLNATYNNESIDIVIE